MYGYGSHSLSVDLNSVIIAEMGVVSSQSMVIFCDNQAVTYVANYPLFYERRKHIEVDCHFIRDMVMAKQIVTSYVTSGARLGNIFSKALFRKSFSIMCNKLGMINIYVAA